MVRASVLVFGLPLHGFKPVSGTNENGHWDDPPPTERGPMIQNRT